MDPADLLKLREQNFVLWNPGAPSEGDPPKLRLGKLVETNTATTATTTTAAAAAAPSFSELVSQPLSTDPNRPGLWLLELAKITPPLVDGLYHYWFEKGVWFTDPLAFAVDYTYITEREGEQPPAVIKVQDGKLIACDPDGRVPPSANIPPMDKVPANNRLVIYELPTTWAKAGKNGKGIEIDAGTFKDVKALFTDSVGDRFSSLSVVRGQQILADLGINALQLLPVADAKRRGEWGYATAHYFAPDFDLGTASDLVSLVNTLTSNGTRLLTDVVMAFGHDPYTILNFPQFHIVPDRELENPDSYQSHAFGQLRKGWGGKLWRYICETKCYDPESGQTMKLHPSWAFHKLHLRRWMNDFAVGGIRVDSVNNIGNWDFVRAYYKHARELYEARYSDGVAADKTKFLVVGEELSMPIDMVRQGFLDALWNERWQQRLRAVVVGEGTQGDNFEWTLRKVIDCRADRFEGGFGYGTQAVNYITSHDIQGDGSEKKRFFNFCVDKGIWDIGKRAKLAFVLLLTSVGIPMIFAGEEFADKQDRSVDDKLKQTDPVNYERLKDTGWRRDLFAYVAKLVKFRIHCPGLATDHTDIFHVDQSRNGKIMAWRRGELGADHVVVIANFSDERTPGSKYVVPNWPKEEGDGWREITQDRSVPLAWVGREPLMPWEAKVYTRWKALGA